MIHHDRSCPFASSKSPWIAGRGHRSSNTSHSRLCHPSEGRQACLAASRMLDRQTRLSYQRWKPRHCTATTHALIQESPQELSLCSLSPLLEFGLTILKQRSLPLSLNHQKHPKRACCHSPGPDRRAANTITTSQPSHNESLASPSPFHPMLKCSRKAVRSASASYVAKCAVRVVPIDATGKYHYDDMSKMI